MTRLIINGDDFGASSSVTRSIVRAYRDGILTSCSLMVGEDGFHEAVRMARDAEGLAVGLHLVAVLGKSVLPPFLIPTLVDHDRNFPASPAKTGVFCFFSKRARRELALEIRAQFERFLETGLPMSHVDSHLHFHLHPVLFQAAVNLCRQYGVRCMRAPQDDPDLVFGFSGKISFQQKNMSRLFTIFARRMKAKLAGEGIACTERVFGHLMTGRMDKAYILHLLDRLPPGDFEIYFHPDEAAEDPAHGVQGQREFEILTDPYVKARIVERGIQLINYGQLARAS